LEALLGQESLSVSSGADGARSSDLPWDGNLEGDIGGERPLADEVGDPRRPCGVGLEDLALGEHSDVEALGRGKAQGGVVGDAGREAVGGGGGGGVRVGRVVAGLGGGRQFVGHGAGAGAWLDGDLRRRGGAGARRCGSLRRGLGCGSGQIHGPVAVTAPVERQVCHKMFLVFVFGALRSCFVESQVFSSGCIGLDTRFEAKDFFLSSKRTAPQVRLKFSIVCERRPFLFFKRL